MDENKQQETEQGKKGGGLLTIVGILIVIGVLLFLFFVTLPFLWWLWLLIIGIAIIAIGRSRHLNE